VTVTADAATPNWAASVALVAVSICVLFTPSQDTVNLPVKVVVLPPAVVTFVTFVIGTFVTFVTFVVGAAAFFVVVVVVEVVEVVEVDVVVALVLVVVLVVVTTAWHTSLVLISPIPEGLSFQ